MPDHTPEDAARWEWSPEEIRRVGYRVVDLIAEHLGTLPDEPVFRPYPPELAEHPAPPATGIDPERILDEFARRIEPFPFGNGHPRFHGWVNSPPTVMGIFAEALAAAMNPSVAGGNHAATHLEHQVLGWFRALLGFPADSGALLVSGGSMATLNALAVARTVAADKDGAEVRAAGVHALPRRLVAYTTAEGHIAIRKALELLGVGHEQLRIIPTDDRRRMLPQALDAAIAADLADGLRPMAVAASAGTVSTGAIDPLDAIADICRDRGVWMHVDGAYGAPAILSDRYREQLLPLARADSVALDPHKWLSVPVEAGLVVVRDATAMRRTFSLVPAYIRTSPEVAGPPWFSEFGVQQSRGFRALKVWMSLMHHGLDGYARSISRDIALAERLAAQVEASSDFELLGHGLSIVCFRYTATPADLDEFNQTLMTAVQLGGQAFLTGARVDGRFALRACFVNPRTRAEHVAGLLDLVRSAAASLAAK